MSGLVQDVRYAVRQLRKAPEFTAVAVVSLALAIGANTAIFTVVNGVLVKPLPYSEPNRLLMIWEKELTDGVLGTVAPANFYDWREQSHSFEKMAAIDPYPDFILNGSGEAQRLSGAAVSADFFSLFGTRMFLGRDFLREEDHPGRDQVVILSYSTWLRYFSGRRDVVGRAVTLNQTPYTVIGVLPRDFSFVSKAADFQSRNRFDVWTPLALASPPPAWQRGTHPLCVFARLNPGVSLRRAQADLDRVAASLEQLYPADDKHRGITATPLLEHVIADSRTALLALLAAVAMVLLIACANLTNLLLSRAETRRKEIALRVALGAGRKRIARQLLTEIMILVLGASGLGLLFVFLSVPALLEHLPRDLPRKSEIGVDWRVLIFTLAVSVMTAIVFGLVPLFHSRRVGRQDSLQESGRGLVTGRSRLRGLLIAGQVAITFVLLIGAGLMTKSLWKLFEVSPGFRIERILTARLSLPPDYTNGYSFGTGKHPRIGNFVREVLERAQAIPGVRSAAFTAYLPLSGVDNSWAFFVEGRPPKPPGVYDAANYRPVSSEYFETLGIPLVRGRAFNASDRENSRPVVIVNESMVRTFWRGEDPVGQRVRFGDTEWRTIVGIAGDVLHQSLDRKPGPEMYVPYEQVPNVEARPTVVLRTSIEPAAVASRLRRAVAEVDPNVPMDQVETMKQIVSGSLGQSLFRTALLLAFALLALFVASVGLYGVMNYWVTQRVPEFGVRMALGASRVDVLRLVLARAAKLVATAAGLGLVGAELSSRAIASLLYRVEPFDVATLLSVSALLVLVALVASYVPARRAAKIDPMVALRYQ